MKNKAIRHGEICFLKIEELPKGLEISKQKEIVKGSHSNSHSYDNGELYLKNVDQYIFGYFVAKDTTLFHPDHGTGKGNIKKASLQDGIYQLRKQQEFINSELKPVVD